MRFLRLLNVIGLLALSACSSDSNTGNHPTFGTLSLFDPVASDPSSGTIVPFPFNGLFSGTSDATLNIPNTAGTSFVTAANLTDGFSTTASIFTDLLGFVDYSTAANAILILDTSTGTFLVPGVDYTVQASSAMVGVSSTSPVTLRPLREHRSRLLIEPLRPLKPSTTYIVAVTTGLQSTDGIGARASDLFLTANSDTKLCRLTVPEIGSELLCTAAGAGAAAAAASDTPVLAVFSATQLATLETLRRSLIRPAVTALKAVFGAVNAPDTLLDSEIVIAWPFTTQSVTKTMLLMAEDATARDLFVANTTISTGELGLGLPDYADIYAGTFAVPYYLANNTQSPVVPPFPNPLTQFWLSDPMSRDSTASFLGTANACALLAQSVSTSVCFPRPLVRSTETIPVLVAVPNNNVCAVNPSLCTDGVVNKPDDGWPVAIFQHGITRSRTDMLAVAPALASAGFVVVAIDMPLHGLTNNSANPATNPFYRNQVLTAGAPALVTGERTFDLDLVDNTPDTANPCLASNNQPDTAIDSSGTHFLNLSSLITSRDNLRQAEVDILELARSMSNLDLDSTLGAPVATDIDENRIHFVGHSLGGAVGTVVLGVVDNTRIQAASLNTPGGTFSKLIDASASFGPRVSSGLGCSGVFEGTDTYETFLRFAQHLTDPGDAINYAVAANANHPIHMIEVINDAVVPNSTESTCPSTLPAGLSVTAAGTTPTDVLAANAAAGSTLLAACPGSASQDETINSGFLSGTDPLVALMGLDVTGPITAATVTPTCVSGDRVVQFAAGTAEHSTLLTPDNSATPTPDADFLAATLEMQGEIASFLASNGAAISIRGGSCAP